MERLVYAIPVIAAVAPRPLVLVGGWLSLPARPSLDPPWVTSIPSTRRRDEEMALEMLPASGVDESGTTGALVQTSSGPVQVDILDITDVALDNLPDEPNDRLYYLAHNWATATAIPMILRTSGSSPVTVRVAQPGPLIAMKLHSLMNRLASKEASDLLDIVRLTLDPVTGVVARQQLWPPPRSFEPTRCFTFDCRSSRTLRGLCPGSELSQRKVSDARRDRPGRGIAHGVFESIACRDHRQRSAAGHVGLHQHLGAIGPMLILFCDSSHPLVDNGDYSRRTPPFSSDESES